MVGDGSMFFEVCICKSKLGILVFTLCFHRGLVIMSNHFLFYTGYAIYWRAKRQETLFHIISLSLHSVSVKITIMSR